MPRLSQYQQDLCDAKMLVAFTGLDSDEEAFEEALEFYALLKSYGSPSTVRLSQKFRPSSSYFTTTFTTLPENDFRALFRTSRQGFAKILKQIQDRPVFKNKPNYPQTDPAHQLAVALACFGACGKEAMLATMGAKFGIAQGTMELYTNRLITALLEVEGNWLRWPEEESREEHGQAMRKEGFPGCVGFMDVTKIRLTQKPAGSFDWFDEYCDKSGRASICIQIVSDINKRIIYYYIGTPGSITKKTVFARSTLCKEPDHHFAPGERVDVCIGSLKSRWRSLQETRQRIRYNDDMKVFFEWVRACCILHNMLLRPGDPWVDIFLDQEGPDPELEPQPQPELVGGKVQPQQPSTDDELQFRESLKKTTLETNHARGKLPALAAAERVIRQPKLKAVNRIQLLKAQKQSTRKTKSAGGNVPAVAETETEAQIEAENTDGLAEIQARDPEQFREALKEVVLKTNRARGALPVAQ
ncbi:hypothetical protein BC939DRAFT_508503 [Gamsiella multidivaricata]|uniref:uncharacterized protein n=1 Tax=Gamsiella multidivaricata TaxID=101098 RepID=UPI00221E6D82|nr:uncharacterized protein BC939DRAFT_508503 [Gamsiella multidivaricata]KAI7816218.1 hypothetical protein BC939DRAFT_508503 [Gamsiella multidivaricata]